MEEVVNSQYLCCSLRLMWFESFALGCEYVLIMIEGPSYDLFLSCFIYCAFLRLKKRVVPFYYRYKPYGRNRISPHKRMGFYSQTLRYLNCFVRPSHKFVE